MRKTYVDMINDDCEMANTLGMIGGKWKMLILFYLLEKERRFNELTRLLGTVTPHTLSEDLKELIEDDLIVKTTFDTLPPKTEYRLTTKGWALESILLDMKAFGRKYPPHWKGANDSSHT